MHRLSVRDSRRRRRRLDAVLALQLLQGHVEVNVAQPRDDELVRLLVSLDVKRRVLLAEACETARDLLLVAAGFGRDGQAVGRAREVEAGQRAAVFLTEGVAR